MSACFPYSLHAGSTHSLLDCAELLELLTEGILIGVPGKASGELEVSNMSKPIPRRVVDVRS